jgi:hypothetical protein
MKGKLYKESNGKWYVVNNVSSLEGTISQKIPVIIEEFDITNPKTIVVLKNDKEVEFEIFEVFNKNVKKHEKRAKLIK